MRIMDKPIDLETARYLAKTSPENVEPLTDNGKITSPLRDYRVRGLPPTPVIMVLVGEYLKRMEAMWFLGDMEDHYREFILYNCEPFGIGIYLAGHNKLRFIVIPTMALYLQPKEMLEIALPKLINSICEFTGCSMDPTRTPDEELQRVYA